MKIKKKFVAMILALVLIASFSVPAFAVNVQYSTTRAFLNAMDDHEKKYTYVGVDNNNDEKVTVSFKGDYKPSIKVNIFFNEDQDMVNMYIWNLIDFDEADYSKVLRVVDELNANYRFTTFCIDKSDWSVTAKYGMHIRTNSIFGETMYEELASIVDVADHGYDMLNSFAK